MELEQSNIFFLHIFYFHLFKFLNMDLVIFPYPAIFWAFLY